MHGSNPILEASGVTRFAADGKPLLLDIDLEVGLGDRIAVRGSSGAGKSLLLRMLAQLDPFDSGAVLWHEAPIADADIPAYRSRVAYHQQSPALVEGRVEQSLRQPFTLAVYADRLFDPARAVDLLEALGRSAALLDAQTVDLSGGERQLVAMVRLLLLDPTVLLLDEPTAALDPASTERVIEVLSAWVSAEGEAGGRRRAYLWVTHDERLGPRVADRSLEMASGRLVEEDPYG